MSVMMGAINDFVSGMLFTDIKLQHPELTIDEFLMLVGAKQYSEQINLPFSDVVAMANIRNNPIYITDTGVDISSSLKARFEVDPDSLVNPKPCGSCGGGIVI